MIHSTDPSDVTADNNEGNLSGNPVPSPLIGDRTDMSVALGMASNVVNSELTKGTPAGSYSDPVDSVPMIKFPDCALCIDVDGCPIT